MAGGPSAARTPRKRAHTGRTARRRHAHPRPARDSCMRVVERARDLVDDPQDVDDRELLAFPKPLAERRAVDERHYVVAVTAGQPRVVQGDEVRVLEPRRNADFTLEAIVELRRGAVLTDDLDRHHAVMAHVAGGEHLSHAARADLSLDEIALAKRITEGGRHVF